MSPGSTERKIIRLSRSCDDGCGVVLMGISSVLVKAFKVEKEMCARDLHVCFAVTGTLSYTHQWIQTIINI